ncbi:Ger(x)C family spore germination protein [Paenibacillus piri]|uniref:Ger(X)C family spore germination protein n=1 Tax=Paenibacillus piri TaxID=2547395 RepID=A0A4R5KHB6_9BACL|nr:Ger(x)C family spore germination protein [Paenibacillus piri]TDF94115.1 Ger(x)C family spore germination protein [Paenibacillus piri]
MVKQMLRIGLALLMTMLVSGCWDRIEINERGFVIGVAIDEPHSEHAEKANRLEARNKPKEKQRYSVTYQVVIPQKLQGGGKERTSDTSFMNMTSEGDTMADIERQMTARTSRSPYFEHLKIIIISNKIAEKKENIGHVLDFFLRDQEIRRSTRVLVSDGEARRALEVVPSNEKLPVMYIHSVTQNSRRTARMLPETKLGDLHELILDRNGFALQRIIGGSNEVKVVGAAVFRGHTITMKGVLGSEETEGLNLLTGKVKNGILKAKLNGNMFVYEMARVKHRIHADVTDPQHIRFMIKIDTEGFVKESLAPLNMMDKQVIRQLEDKLSQEMKRMTRDAINKLQKQFKVDAIGLGSYLEKNHYPVWKDIAGHWDPNDEDNLFSRCTIDVQPHVQLRRAGTINRTFH